MATFKPTVPANWVIEKDREANAPTLWERFTAFANRQKERRAIWFFTALTVQGVFFLPLPAYLVYYYGASVAVLFITMACFFTTIIAYMGGARIRTVILLSVLSILVQLITAVVIMTS